MPRHNLLDSPFLPGVGTLVANPALLAPGEREPHQHKTQQTEQAFVQFAMQFVTAATWADWTAFDVA